MLSNLTLETFLELCEVVMQNISLIGPRAYFAGKVLHWPHLVGCRNAFLKTEREYKFFRIPPDLAVLNPIGNISRRENGHLFADCNIRDNFFSTAT